MSEDSYGALMMKRALPVSQDLKAITAPGIYPVEVGNATAPSSLAGTLITLPLTSAAKLLFIGSDGNTYKPITSGWQAFGEVKSVNGHLPDAAGSTAVTSQDIFDTQSIGIPSAADLNAYQTPGLYFQPSIAQAQAGFNYPEATAGSLEVYKAAGVIQVYRVYVGSKCYVRSFYDNTWSVWSALYDTANKPTAADTGALPVDGTAAAATRLVTPRAINGVPFDGTADITISASAVGSYTKEESDAKYQLKNAASGSTNGWFKDSATGIITQWGMTTSVSASQPITFPIAFPSICANVQVSAFTNGVAGTMETGCSAYSNVAATLTANQPFNLFWLATGY